MTTSKHPELAGAVKERPILFSGSMVKALLAGTKTQTRRVVKPQPDWIESSGRWHWPLPKRAQKPGCCTSVVTASREWHEYLPAGCCPYGQPGDRLWVRENGWQRPDRTPKWMREGADTWPPYIYDADEHDFNVQETRSWCNGFNWKRRPSIHMPRWASRLTLEIVSVRVERVASISNADAKAEGVTFDGREYRDAFRDLWDNINAARDGGKYSWASNPFCWCLEFRRIDRKATPK